MIHRNADGHCSIVGALFLQHPSQLDESRTADVKQKEKIRYNIQVDVKSGLV
ncbi:hypothetical protein T03_9967 [Trichinella britovi]|uniref:Uncharacterized protein n=2 Tax=Trichinella TaxID=6333 RepID=A0A0V1CPR9_TRIBR|nr:hypothetical protein T05_3025 [Trichinella murrelli]KRY51268.1 hypothetical protein T03_9967 [Trichinella britovi]